MTERSEGIIWLGPPDSTGRPVPRGRPVGAVPGTGTGPRHEAGRRAVEIVFETHSITVDNERGIATGWLPGELSEAGRRLARELGERRRADGISVVYVSDLARAVQTASIAFGRTPVKVVQDRRLRECDYGECNGMPTARLARLRSSCVDQPFPGGESYRDVVVRTRDFVAGLLTERPGEKVLVISHSANKWALDHLIHGVPLAQLVDAPFGWREGWHYMVEEGPHHFRGAGTLRR